MKIRVLISAIGFMVFLTANGQKLPVKEMNSFFSKAFNRFSSGLPDHASIGKSSPPYRIPSGVNQVLQKLHLLTGHFPANNSQGGDTLVIGLPPNDSLIIMGNYTHIGPVIVVGNGILRFKNAHATIVGDIWVIGANALVTADSSYLYCPQAYFYQRSMIIAKKGLVKFNNTTLDFSGLSHNLLLIDSSSIRMNHVKDIGFTTCGLRDTPIVDIENSDVPSEYVITGHAKLNFKNDKTLLLWHQIPDSGVINLTFPRGDTVNSYHFNNTVPGISGINYHLVVDTCYNVMWALMPSTGSSVTIADSKLRAVGL